MFSCSNKIFFSVLFMIFLISHAYATYPVAGEKLKKQETTPYFEVEPTRNITDIVPPVEKGEAEPDIYFVADELISNDKDKILEAKGDVIIRRSNLTLYTDRLVYEQETDNIIAIGNVRLEEQDGHVVYADRVNLANKMSKVEMNKIKVILSDETQIWADQFRKKENDNKIMRNALYTPCDFCEDTEKPLWQIRARKVTHDAQRKDINYNDAFLDIKGVPVLYTPFLSHPDPTVRRRSGFLTPNIGSSNYLGGTLQLNYFWDINNNSDLLLSPILTTDKDIVWGGRYRGYFTNGYLNFEGTYLKDDNEQRGDHRGNLFARTRYEINDFWVADADINYASDSLYLKELNLSGEDNAWLNSNVKFQRFENRNYALVEALYYKLISYDLREHNVSEYARMKYNKPLVIPFVEYEFMSDINKIGSYWKNNFSWASVYHEGDNSSHRFTMINSWNLPWISPFGERYKIVASLKSDAYYVDGYSEVGTTKNYSGDVVRIFPQLGIEWKLPLVKATEDSRQIIEPIIVGVLAPNGGSKTDKIPNEDSEDVELDDTNILDLDRYSGYDRNDNGSRITYGLNWSSYGEMMGRTSAFIAQTYHFNKSNSFAKSIENEGYFSDYVGRIYAAPSDNLDLNYRFRLDKDSYKLQYSELGAKMGNDLLNMYISYIYLQKNKNATELFDKRRELYTSVKASLTRDWSVSVYNRQDLSGSGKSLEHGGNLIYEDECFKFITTVKKYNSNDPSLDNDYEFNFTFYLKTLGGVGA